MLLVSKAFPPAVGGIETYSEQVSRQYIAAGFEVTVITRACGGRTDHMRKYDEGALRVLQLGGTSQLGFFWRLLFLAAGLSLRGGFDVVHCTTWRTAIGVLPFFWRAHICVTVHGREVLVIGEFLSSLLRLVLWRASVVVCVSGATREALADRLRVTPAKTIVALNGLTYRQQAEEFDYRSKSQEHPIEVLSLARFVPRKNLERCIIAVAALRDRGVTDFRYTIAGSGPLEAELHSACARLNVSSLVSFPGRVDEARVPELLKGASIFFHPQIATDGGKDMEGFGLIIADAMSFGCAVLVGEQGGPSEFVMPGLTGLLVNGLDQEVINDSLELLVTAAASRARLGRAAREYALAELSWTKHVQTILDYLDDMAHTRT